MEVDGDGPELLKSACSHGLEGMIAKHRDSKYRPGRTGDWLKIRCVQSESFVIVGYEQPALARRGVGTPNARRSNRKRLDIRRLRRHRFKERDAAYLKETLDKLKTKRPAVPINGKNLVFAQPTLIAESDFRGWAEDGNLRLASHKGGARGAGQCGNF